MTTIAYRDGVMAADSCLTEESESGGSRAYQCRKIYKKRVVSGPTSREVLIGLSGAGGPGLLFLEWYGSGMERPEIMDKDMGDFGALVVDGDTIAVYDRFYVAEPVIERYHAIGSGAKCAFVAMDMGATALHAVQQAAIRDVYTRPPFVTEKL